MDGVVLRWVVEVRDSSTNLDLDELSGAFAYIEVVFFTHIFHDFVGEIVASDTY